MTDDDDDGDAVELANGDWDQLFRLPQVACVHVVALTWRATLEDVRLLFLAPRLLLQDLLLREFDPLCWSLQRSCPALPRSPPRFLLLHLPGTPPGDHGNTAVRESRYRLISGARNNALTLAIPTVTIPQDTFYYNLLAQNYPGQQKQCILYITIPSKMEVSPQTFGLSKSILPIENPLRIIEYLGIILFLWTMKVHTFIWNDL